MDTKKAQPPEGLFSSGDFVIVTYNSVEHLMEVAAVHPQKIGAIVEMKPNELMPCRTAYNLRMVRHATLGEVLGKSVSCDEETRKAAVAKLWDRETGASENQLHFAPPITQGALVWVDIDGKKVLREVESLCQNVCPDPDNPNSEISFIVTSDREMFDRAMARPASFVDMVQSGGDGEIARAATRRMAENAKRAAAQIELSKAALIPTRMVKNEDIHVLGMVPRDSLPRNLQPRIHGKAMRN